MKIAAKTEPEINQQLEPTLTKQPKSQNKQNICKGRQKGKNNDRKRKIKSRLRMGGRARRRNKAFMKPLNFVIK